MTTPVSLSRGVSPPPLRKSLTSQSQMPVAQAAQNEVKHGDDSNLVDPTPTLAAVEAGQAQIRDHVEYFSKHLKPMSRANTIGPRLSIDDYKALYKRNQHRHGRHFVVNQHDHPISGVHYDLRLQFSETSSVSFAIPYGLPGNPNSQRPNRMAIETRVHCVWNHLIETASHATGSLLIWDTGEYEILPRSKEQVLATDDESSDSDALNKFSGRSQSERLFAAFQARHIRLRLHGTRLPPGYTVSLRLPTMNDRSRQPRNPKRKRRRLDPTQVEVAPLTSSDDNTSEDDTHPGRSDAPETAEDGEDEAGNASDHDEDTSIRANNAYPGAINTIGSVHQRNWFLTLDRRSSGFYKARRGSKQGLWVGSWRPFFVRGRDVERSVVTGRSADEVMEDEGVEKFVGRKMWRAILE